MENRQGIWGVDESLVHVMMQVRKAIRNVLREVAKTEQLSQNEIEVLLMLSHEKFDTAAAIARTWGVSRSLVSKSVESLQSQGYIQAKQDENDRRLVHLTLCPKAQSIVSRLEQAKTRFLEALCAGITWEEGEAFMSIVKKLKENLKTEFSGAVSEELPESQAGKSLPIGFDSKKGRELFL